MFGKCGSLVVRVPARTLLASPTRVRISARGLSTGRPKGQQIALSLCEYHTVQIIINKTEGLGVLEVKKEEKMLCIKIKTGLYRYRYSTRKELEQGKYNDRECKERTRTGKGRKK